MWLLLFFQGEARTLWFEKHCGFLRIEWMTKLLFEWCQPFQLFLKKFSWWLVVEGKVKFLMIIFNVFFQLHYTLPWWMCILTILQKPPCRFIKWLEWRVTQSNQKRTVWKVYKYPNFQWPPIPVIMPPQAIMLSLKATSNRCPRASWENVTWRQYMERFGTTLSFWVLYEHRALPWCSRCSFNLCNLISSSW